MRELRGKRGFFRRQISFLCIRALCKHRLFKIESNFDYIIILIRKKRFGSICLIPDVNGHKHPAQNHQHKHRIQLKTSHRNS